MRIAVVGAGYVGLVAAACFADTGNTVHVVERDPEKLAALASGRSPFYEPELEEVLGRTLGTGRLTVVPRLSRAVRESTLVVVAVGTPEHPRGGADLASVEAVLDELAAGLTGYTVILLKSTVPPGTHARLDARLAARTEASYDLVSNPEFLREGSAVQDFRRPDRVVIGARSPRPLALLERLYAPFLERSEQLITMTPESAELTKYASNALLATRLTFLNEIAGLCESVGADIRDVAHGLRTDHRIGPHYLSPSLGYGGSCLPKDVRTLVGLMSAAGVDPGLLQAVDAVNRGLPARLVRRMQAALGDLAGKTIAMWGIAFKAGTDDTRESTAVVLAEQLVALGAQLRIHDPAARLRLEGPVEWVDDRYEAVQDADALVVCTEWSTYRAANFGRIAERMRGSAVFDTRNLYEASWLTPVGLEHHGLGR